MKTLETSYAGLKLKNPIIVSSSSLTDSAEKKQETLRGWSWCHRLEITL
jgi:dihydroorotate dehydrogenase